MPGIASSYEHGPHFWNRDARIHPPLEDYSDLADLLDPRVSVFTHPI